jgi:hypothetical protein
MTQNCDLCGFVINREGNERCVKYEGMQQDKALFPFMSDSKSGVTTSLPQNSRLDSALSRSASDVDSSHRFPTLL